MGKKVKKDEKPPPDDVFDPLLVESKQAATVVLMLDSPEEEVLSKACEAIYLFSDKCDENKKLLLDLGVMDKLLKLIQIDDRVIRRNACMAFGVLSGNADVRKLLRKREETIPAVINLLNPEEDTIIHEFAALCLSFMCNDFSSLVSINDQNGIEALIRCMYSHDPDVQKNGVETLASMMQDFNSRTVIREQNGLEPMLDLIKSEYPVIQEFALIGLTRAAQDAENRAALRELEALNMFVEFVGKPEFNDLHVHALHCLSNCLEDPDSLQQIKENGGLARLLAFITDVTPPEEEAGGKKEKKPGSKKGKKGKDEEENKDKTGEPSHTLPEVKKHCCRAIARAAKNAENRKMLHDQEAEKCLILLLTHEDPNVQIAAAQAVGVLSENTLSRDSFGEWEGIDPLVKMLKTDNGEVKEASTLALANLTTANSNNCWEVINRNGTEPLIHLLSDQNEAVVANAASVLTNLSLDEHMRCEILRHGLVPALIEPLKSKSASVNSKAALAVAGFITDADMRVEFVKQGGLEPLVELLKSNDEDVRRSASWAVTVLAVDEPTAIEFGRLGCLAVLQDIQLSGTRANRFTDAALHKLLDSNLSAKYALSGIVGPSNLISDGFYDAGQQRPGLPFRSLEEYCKDEVNQRRPILLVNAVKTHSDAHMNAETEPIADVSPKISKTATGRDSKASNKAGRNRSAEKERLKAEPIPETPAEQRPFVMPADPNMMRYIEEVTERILPVGNTKQQVIALAEYVADKMGGPIERGQMSNFSYELPISQIKFNLQSNVIPIGMIATGIHYHRALLFKALADRIALPCSLIRGEYNRAWNEIQLQDDAPTPNGRKYPPKPYLVDLIHEPGTLYPLDSVEASNYQKL